MQAILGLQEPCYRSAAAMMGLAQSAEWFSSRTVLRFDHADAIAGCRAVRTSMPRGTYPLLAVSGDHGSAKTALSMLLKLLIDPNAAPVWASSCEERELMGRQQRYLLAFDKLSGFPVWLSDAGNGSPELRSCATTHTNGSYFSRMSSGASRANHGTVVPSSSIRISRSVNEIGGRHVRRSA
jgi:hypothetical protein